jgi:hypothetical protein
MTNGYFLVALERDSDIAKTLDDVGAEFMRQEMNFEKMFVCPACPEYDDDPREVWQIPEGVEMFRRAIDCGLYGLLTLPAMFNKQLDVTENSPLIFSFTISQGVGEFTIDMQPAFELAFKRSCVVWNQRHPVPVKRCGTCKCVQFGPSGTPSGTGRVCAACGARSQSLMCCGGCHTVSYCNRTCQRAHWSKHKSVCRRAK